jgi:TPR repeat protein
LSLPAQNAAAKIENFKNADVQLVTVPYFQGLSSVSSFTEEQVCSADSKKLYEQLIKLNPSSIYIHYIKSSCSLEVNSEQEYLQELENITELVAEILKEGVGDTIDTAISIRELPELNAILELAGLVVLDIEVLIVDGQPYYRAHSYDTVNGNFSYRYATNIEFFQNFYSKVMRKSISETKASEFLMSTFMEEKSPYIFPFLAKGFAYAGKHKAVTGNAQKFESTPLGEVLIAESALVINNDVLLESLLENILNYAEQGFVPASNFINVFLFVQDAGGSWPEIKARMKEIDATSHSGFSIQLFLESLSRRPDFTTLLQTFIELEGNQAIEYINTFSRDFAAMKPRLPYDIENIEMKLMKVLADAGQGFAQHFLAMRIFKQRDISSDQLHKAQAYLESAAQDGYSDALVDLGLQYDTGQNGFEKSPQKAFELYLKASEQGNKFALHNVASSYRYGTAGELNIPLAIEYFHQSFKAGYSPAYCKLGNIYRFDLQTPDYDKAEEYYQLAIKNPEGYKDIKFCYEGLGILANNVDKDFKRAQEMFESAIALGSGFAAHQIARIYHFGKYGVVDIAKAIEYYERGIALGSYNGVANIGFIFESGEGEVEIDLAKALSYYQLGAEHEIAQAINNLGTFYFNGTEVEKNIQKALELYKKAADMGNDFASENYGDHLWQGKHIDANYIRACHYYQQAYDQQYGQAYSDLAYCYFSGKGRPKDRAKGFDILNEGIENGISSLYLALGTELVSDGLYVEAQSRLEDAVNLGVEGAHEKLALVYKKLERYELAYNAYEQIKEPSDDVLQTMAIMRYLGQGTIKNEEDAMASLHQIAINKSLDVNAYLGDLYYNGAFGKADYRVARMHYELVQVASPSMLYNYATMFLKGNGVGQDVSKAVRLYEQASIEENKNAYYALANMYRDGNHFNQSTIEMGNLLLKAAELGHRDATLSLSKAYLDGTLVEPSEKSAKYWLNKALSYSDEAYILLGDLFLASKDTELFNKGIYLLNVAIQSDIDGAQNLQKKYSIATETLLYE